MMFYAIFSEKYMPQFADFWAAFSSVENALENLMALPIEIVRDHKLEIYEVPVDSKDKGKKRLDANDPRITEAAKSLANRRRNGS